ncbi:hypothetical protein [Polaribacter sp.]|uniref:hypothetical protein n=1 Tax=Polaribacter sp. TaxID=1920175 RepID=UPI0025DE2F92|nr:hypothetical protein [Polaribacter sp.]
MEIAEFKDIITKKIEIHDVETTTLKSVIDTYPYFQLAQVLYLEKLKKDSSFKYNKQLKKTAAHTKDRSILFEYITSPKFSQNKKSTKQSKTDFTTTAEDADITPLTNNAKKELAVGEPLQFKSTESYSFNQWLQLSTKKTIQREKLPKTDQKNKADLVNKFIENNPKIEPLSKDKNINIQLQANRQDNSLMTETLAKVYLEQKKYENAIQAYRILSLKYPEKSGFFADQIKRIKILQKNK